MSLKKCEKILSIAGIKYNNALDILNEMKKPYSKEIMYCLKKVHDFIMYGYK